MILVADCSALIALSTCNCLEQLFSSVSKLNHISTIGSLGILLVAKQKGLIKEIAPFLEALEKSELYLSKQLITTVLELAGEANLSSFLE